MDNTKPEPSQQPPEQHPRGDGAAESPRETDAPTETVRTDESSKPDRFNALLTEVEGLPARPLNEHNDVFSRAHRTLTEALNDVERGDS